MKSLLLFMLLISTKAVCSEFDHILPGVHFDETILKLKNIKTCQDSDNPDDPREWASSDCMVIDGSIRQLSIKKNTSISNSDAELSFMFFDEILINKKYEIFLRNRDREFYLSEYIYVTNKISSMLNEKPIVGRFWSSVAVDRSLNYNDFNHFVDVAKKVERWEPIKGNISDSKWNSIVAFWPVSDALLIEARFQFDELIGASIHAIFEDPKQCETLLVNGCFSFKQIREMASNKSFKRDVFGSAKSAP